MHSLNKIPQVTAFFWVMKICATTLGETGGDWLSMTMNVGYALSSIILISIFLVSLFFQLMNKGYHPLLYWTVILTTSTAGTTMSDFMDRTMQLGYAKGSLLLVTLLMATLAVWRWQMGTISVTSIHNRKAEIFYWVAILFSNTLGTALGDFLADDSGLGFVGGAALISTSLVMIYSAYRFTSLSHVLLYWAAFILTRPFGATFGDLLTKSHEKGGLDLGTVGSSLVLLTLLIGCIVYVSRTYKTDSVAEEPIDIEPSLSPAQTKGIKRR